MNNIKKNIYCVVELAKKLSPLRYPGGKSRAVELITTKYIIPNLSERQNVCSPFFGGGSIELYLAKKGYKVSGYDDFRSLVDFWKILRFRFFFENIFRESQKSNLKTQTTI